MLAEVPSGVAYAPSVPFRCPPTARLSRGERCVPARVAGPVRAWASMWRLATALGRATQAASFDEAVSFDEAAFFDKAASLGDPLSLGILPSSLALARADRCSPPRRPISAM